MTPREADKIIKAGQPVTVRNTVWNEQFTVVFVGRDRWNMFTDQGGVMDRGELVVVPPQDG